MPGRRHRREMRELLRRRVELELVNLSKVGFVEAEKFDRPVSWDETYDGKKIYLKIYRTVESSNCVMLWVNVDDGGWSAYHPESGFVYVRR